MKNEKLFSLRGLLRYLSFEDKSIVIPLLVQAYRNTNMPYAKIINDSDCSIYSTSEESLMLNHLGKQTVAIYPTADFSIGYDDKASLYAINKLGGVYPLCLENLIVAWRKSKIDNIVGE
jgi:hypothetical protein